VYGGNREAVRVLLDLGVLFATVEVEINGIACGVRAWAPFFFDISTALHSGQNRIEVRVTNTLANQWARPYLRARDFTEYSNPYLARSAPFLDESVRAGLSGPVYLRFYTPAPL
jgi:hypothetical protein